MAILVSILVFFILAEVTAGMILRRPSVLDIRNRLYEYDSDLGWRIPPLTEVVISGPNGRYSVAYNSRGLRGPEYPEKGENEYRVLVLGDAYAEGFETPFEKLSSQVLKAALNQSVMAGRRDCEVISAGTGGFSTDQELIYFQTKGKDYRPDLTVLLFCYDDVLCNSRKIYPTRLLPKPLFVLKEGALTLTNVPVPGTPGRLNAPKASGAFQWLSLVALMRKRTAERRFRDPRRNMLRVFQRPESPEMQEAWKLTAAIVRKLSEEARGLSGEFLLVYVPPGVSVFPPAWNSLRSQFKLDAEGWSFDQVPGRLAEICNLHKIHYLDLTEDLRRAEGPEATLYDLGSGHWTIRGHEVVGKLLAKWVSSHCPGGN